MTTFYAIYIFVTLKATGELQVIPMNRYFINKEVCEQVAEKYTENMALFPSNRDFEAQYICTEAELGGNGT